MNLKKLGEYLRVWRWRCVCVCRWGGGLRRREKQCHEKRGKRGEVIEDAGIGEERI